MSDSGATVPLRFRLAHLDVFANLGKLACKFGSGVQIFRITYVMMVIRRQVDYERFVLEGDGSGVVDGWCGWCFFWQNGL